MVEQDLGEERELLRVHAQLAGARAEQIAFDADDVAHIENLVERVVALGDGVLADVDLEPLARCIRCMKPALPMRRTV